MVIHQGATCEKGHYITICQWGKKHQWYRCDDMTVTPVSVDYVFNQNPYLLFYKRIE